MPSFGRLIIRSTSQIGQEIDLYSMLIDFYFILSSTVGWSCRMYYPHLCRWVRRMSRRWQNIWWWGSSNTGALANARYSFIAIASRSTLVTPYFWIVYICSTTPYDSVRPRCDRTVMKSVGSLGTKVYLLHPIHSGRRKVRNRVWIALTALYGLRE